MKALNKTPGLILKLIALVALASSLPVFVGIGYSILESKNEFLNIYSKEIESKQLALQNEIEKLKSTLKIYSTLPPLSGLLRAYENKGVDPYDGSSANLWESRLHEIMQTYLVQYPEIEKLTLFLEDHDRSIEIDKGSISTNNSLETNRSIQELIKTQNKDHLRKIYFCTQESWGNPEKLQLIVINKDPTNIVDKHYALLLEAPLDSILNSSNNKELYALKEDIIIDSEKNILSTNKDIANIKELLRQKNNTFYSKGYYYLFTNPITPGIKQNNNDYYWTYASRINDSLLLKASLKDNQSLIIIMLTVLIAAIAFSIYFSKNTVKRITTLSNDLSQEASKIASASEQLKTSSQTLSKNSQEQASSMQQISASIEESLSMILLNANNAKHVKKLATQARSVAEEGTSSMQKMLQTMEKVSGSSEGVANTTKIIDEIAFQTNILALNASVEAARAGELGKGFGAVADEVRNLAQRSANAAKESSVEINHSIESSKQGLQISVEASDKFDDIRVRVIEMNNAMSEIATSSEEQKQGIEQITQAILSIDQTTQDNATEAMDTAQAAESLQVQALQMKDIVSKLMELTGSNS